MGRHYGRRPIAAGSRAGQVVVVVFVEQGRARPAAQGVTADVAGRMLRPDTGSRRVWSPTRSRGMRCRQGECDRRDWPTDPLRAPGRVPRLTVINRGASDAVCVNAASHFSEAWPQPWLAVPAGTMRGARSRVALCTFLIGGRCISWSSASALRRAAWKSRTRLTVLGRGFRLPAAPHRKMCAEQAAGRRPAAESG